jgi:predicted MFS family arabinose efflux permease
MHKFWTLFSSRAALAGLMVSLLIAAATEVVNVVFGVWLNDSFSWQIAALGGASAVIGLSELIGEGAVSAVSDALSKKKAVFWGALANSGAALSLILLGRVQWGAVLGLFLFYLTFEFTIVSAIPLMTGVVPEARATMMALNIASVSLGRGLGSLAAAPLYSRGFLFNAVAGALINLLALIALRLVIVKEKG